MEFAKNENQSKNANANLNLNPNPKPDITSIKEFHKNTKIDVELLDQYVKHMNRVYDRDPEGFLLDNGSYVQLVLIKKQMEDTMKEVNEALDKLNEFKQLKTKLEQINKCILFEFI